jgi:putative membrane protein
MQEAGKMSDENISGESGRFTVRTAAETHFAWLRTRLAVERTILAWVRTAVSLVGFGFTIVQFFDRLQQMPGVAPARFPDAPRYLGLAMISCGVISLAISMWEYWWMIRYLWSHDYAPIAGIITEGRHLRHSPIIAVVVVLMLVGIFAFFAVLLRLV